MSQLTQSEMECRELEYERRLAEAKRFKALCAKIRAGHATYEESQQAWNWAAAEEDRIYKDGGGRVLNDITGLIPKWQPPVDDLEHALAMANWC